MKKPIRILAYISLGIHIVMLLILFLPKEHTKPIRFLLSKIVMKLWVGFSRVWTVIYEDLQ